MVGLLRRMLGGGAMEEGLALSPREVAFTVLDLEMTGLTPGRDSIVSFGAVRMQGGRILAGETFCELVRPRTTLTAESVRIHQITPGEVSNGPETAGVLASFFEFCRDTVVVGHCVALDLAFLRAEARKAGLPDPKAELSRAVDTAGLYRWLRERRAAPPLEKLPPQVVELYAIAAALGIEVKGAHDALADAWITAQVFQRFLAFLEAAEEGGLTLGQLLEAGDPRGENRPLRHAY